MLKKDNRFRIDWNVQFLSNFCNFLCSHHKMSHKLAQYRILCN